MGSRLSPEPLVAEGREPDKVCKESVLSLKVPGEDRLFRGEQLLEVVHVGFWREVDVEWDPDQYDYRPGYLVD